MSITQADAIARSQESCDGCKLITEAEWMTIAMDVVNNPANWSGGAVGNGTINRGNSNSSATMSGSNELAGVNKRTHTLSNGEVIWDLAGNAYEWTQGTITGGQPGVSGQSSWAWRDYTATNFNWNSLPPNSRPAGVLHAGSTGVGRVTSNVGDSITRPFARGGSWSNDIGAGVWSLYLYTAPNYTNEYFGFRVTR